MPNEFATALTTWMDDDKVSGRSLADQCGVSSSTISQWRTGTLEPTRTAIAKLLPVITKHYSSSVSLKLLIAHLRDDVPESMRTDVRIEPSIPLQILRDVDPQVELNAWLDEQARSSASFTVWLQFMRELMKNPSPPSFQLMRKENPKFGTAFPDLGVALVGSALMEEPPKHSEAR